MPRPRTTALLFLLGLLSLALASTPKRSVPVSLAVKDSDDAAFQQHMSQADQAEKLVDRIESNLVIQGQHKFHTEYEHLKDGLQKTADGVFRNARDRLDESTEVRIGAAIAKAKLDGASAPAEYASLVKLAHSVESA